MNKRIEPNILIILILFFAQFAYGEPTAEDYLITAVHLNDVSAVKKHLANSETVAREIDPVCHRNELCKPVFFAARNGSLEIMKLLLDAGADVNGVGGFAKDTPLLVATVQKNLQLANLLIDRGADISQPNRFGCTPLWGACAAGQSEFVELYLRNNANIDQTARFPDPLRNTKGGRKKAIVEHITPLMISVAFGYEKIVGLLLREGANSDLIDSLGRTVVDYARIKGKSEIIGFFQ